MSLLRCAESQALLDDITRKFVLGVQDETQLDRLDDLVTVLGKPVLNHVLGDIVAKGVRDEAATTGMKLGEDVRFAESEPNSSTR